MHASAFGLSILNENINSLKTYIEKELKDFTFTNSYRVDFIWDANEINKYQNDILKIGELSNIWGQGLKEPYIAIENIKINQDNLILMSPDKKPTLKIILPNGLTLIKFKSSQEEYELLQPTSENNCVIINVVGTCNLNEWMGNINPQIIIEDYNVITSSRYYF